MGNGETRELVCMTHGHELKEEGILEGVGWRGKSGGNAGCGGVPGGGGQKLGQL